MEEALEKVGEKTREHSYGRHKKKVLRTKASNASERDQSEGSDMGLIEREALTHQSFLQGTISSYLLLCYSSFT